MEDDITFVVEHEERVALWCVVWRAWGLVVGAQQAYQGGNHVGNQRKGWLVPTNVVTNVVGNHFSAR